MIKINDWILYKGNPIQVTEVTDKGIKCDRLWIGYQSIGFSYDVNKLGQPKSISIKTDRNGW